MSSILPSSRGRLANTGLGMRLVPLDIGHNEYMAVVDPETAFWALTPRDELAETLCGGPLLEEPAAKREILRDEIEGMRFRLTPMAVYFNATDRCNLDCTYCYIPQEMRRNGCHMSADELCRALTILRDYFAENLPAGRKPDVIFHGAEPLLNREAVFTGIDRFADDFRFGIQTNGTLLDDEAIAFLTSRKVGIGLSLDGHEDAVADRTRKTWGGAGTFASIDGLFEKLRGYPNYNVLCTVTKENMTSLIELVDYLHARHVPVCMLNPLRCTSPAARPLKPEDAELVPHYLRALERTHELFRETGRKLVVANFANIVLSIVAPTARRLLCDISPCGGGRAFFAVAADGGLFPCSEFIGLSEFRGGNLFTDKIDDVLRSEAFRTVTERKVEDIAGCATCAIRHFCGSPCPAEAHEMNGSMQAPGAFCELYEEQVRYAFRLIADGRETDFLLDDWDVDTEKTIDIGAC
ncbi:peptide-modifying radical SAM enzyme CbpB [Thermostilla marina]